MSDSQPGAIVFPSKCDHVCCSPRGWGPRMLQGGPWQNHRIQTKSGWETQTHTPPPSKHKYYINIKKINSTELLPLLHLSTSVAFSGRWSGRFWISLCTSLLIAIKVNVFQIHIDKWAVSDELYVYKYPLAFIFFLMRISPEIEIVQMSF